MAKFNSNNKSKPTRTNMVGDVGYRAAFVTSYITTSDKKLKDNLDSENTIFLHDSHFESKKNIVIASDEEKGSSVTASIQLPRNSHVDNS